MLAVPMLPCPHFGDGAQLLPACARAAVGLAFVPEERG